MKTQEQTLWQKNKWILYLLIIVIIASYILDRFNNSSPSVVVVPEQKGSFKTNKVKNEPIIKSVTITQNGIGQKLSKNERSKEGPENNQFLDKKIDSLLKVNAYLLGLFEKSKGHQKDSLYQKAIQLNKFSHPFEDDKVKIDVSGISRGPVEAIKIDYTFKEQQIPIKERVFALKTGVEYGNTTSLSNSVFKGNLEFENKKGNSYSISYDTDSRYWIGAKFTIFTIKR